MVIRISVGKTLENHDSVGSGARNIEKIVCFLPNFNPHFPNIQRARNSYKIYIESIGKCFKNIKTMEVTTLLCILIYFHFV